jgi:hypothetical protein
VRESSRKKVKARAQSKVQRLKIKEQNEDIFFNKTYLLSC